MISSSVDMVQTVILDYMNPHYDPELEDSKPIFLHNTLAQDDVSLTKFGYKRFSSWVDIVQMDIH